jgi:uracil-DNA glycosylase family 4
MPPETLKLYEEVPKAAVEREPALNINRACTRCELGSACDDNGTPDAKNRCIPADGGAGDLGDLLIVGEGIGKEEDKQGAPFVSKVGTYLRGMVAKLWQGKVVWDTAVRCYAGGKEFKHEQADACRGYLAGTIDEVKPTRIISLGSQASYTLLGRNVPPFSTRRGWGWLANNGNPIPVFFLLPPGAALRNVFVQRWFEADLKWALTFNPPKPPWDLPVQVISSLEESQAACAQLRLSEWIAFDVETAGRMYDPDFKMLSISIANSEADLCFAWDAGGLLNYFDPVKDLLKDSTVKKVGQNLKYDLATIREAMGFWVEGIHGDTRLWRKLIDPEAEANLATMGELIGMGGHKEEADKFIRDYVSKFKRAQTAAAKSAKAVAANPQGTLIPNVTLDQDAEMRLGSGDPYAHAYAAVPREVLLRYNGRDSVVTAILGNVLEAQIAAEPNIQGIWDKVVGPASHAIARVERWGVPCSKDALNAFKGQLDINLSGVEKRLALHGNINWGSTLQLRKFLYETLGLAVPDGALTDSGLPSTDESTLKLLKAQHTVAGDILDFRFLNKMKGTYAEGMMEHVRADGRVHGSINLDGARSGRTSMSDPNLQNIPRSKDSLEGKMAKDCFRTEKGFSLVEFDYGQLELVIAALLSGDEEMIAIFRSGQDYHLRTAQLISYVWGKKPEEILPDSPERTAAKSFNFGILYGMSDASIAHNAGISIDEAKKIRAAIFGKFKRLAEWVKESLAFSKRTGEVWTTWDGQPARRRSLFRIGNREQNDDNAMAAKGNAERSSWNSRVQGTASEFCIASLVRCVSLIENDGLPAELVLPVHDSLLFVVPDANVKDVAYEVREAMTNYAWLGTVPLKVDVKAGPSWGSLTKLAL